MNSDTRLRESPEALPTGNPRSKLEPHYNLIRELRRRRCTYKQVAQYLADQMGLLVTPSTIHSFVAIRAKRRSARPLEYELPPLAEAERTETTSQPVAGEDADGQNPIDRLRRRPAAPAKERRFDFRPEEKLKLTAPRKEGPKHE